MDTPKISILMKMIRMIQ